MSLERAQAALRALVADYDAGGQQDLRINGCGDLGCGYSSCELARALGFPEEED